MKNVTSNSLIIFHLVLPNTIFQKCPECETTYTRHCNLVRHVRNIHNSVIPYRRKSNLLRVYECSVCSIRMTRKLNFIQHVQSHKNDREFPSTEPKIPLKDRKLFVSSNVESCVSSQWFSQIPQNTENTYFQFRLVRSVVWNSQDRITALCILNVIISSESCLILKTRS